MGATTVTSHPGWRIERTAPGESAAAWHSALSTFDARTASPLKEEGDNATMVARLDGHDVVLKRWRLLTLWDRLKHIARASRAWRQWRGAELLNASGIPAARCLAIARSGTFAWLIMELVPGRSLLEHLAGVARVQLSPRQQHALARAIATMLARLETSGIYNRDGKPSNLLVSGFDAGGHAQLVVIDTVGVRARCPANGAITMLKNLCMEPLGHHCLPRKALMARVIHELLRAPSVPLRSQRRGWLWSPQRPEPGEASGETHPRTVRRHLWSAVAAAIKAHGDPSPRVDILSVVSGGHDSRRNPLAPSANTK